MQPMRFPISPFPAPEGVHVDANLLGEGGLGQPKLLSETGMPRDRIDPRHHRVRSAISVARTVNAHPTILQQILCGILAEPGGTEVAEKWRRNAANQLIESSWIGTLVLRHEVP
jgi:hypothetical protein